jgi:hypothetical protein
VAFEVLVENNYPQFEGLKTTHTISVNYDENLLLVEDPTYNYASPKMKDPDGHETKIDFKGDKAYDFLTFAKSSDEDSFTFVVDRTKVKESVTF